jgi:plastocyanin
MIYRRTAPLLWAPALGLLLGGCDSLRTTPPPVQDSSPQTATSVIHVRAGQQFTPSCTIVQTGTTIEWRNLTPSTAIAMVSTAAPYELSSPALRDPYNSIPAETSDECALRTADGCMQAVPFSFWRHTFNAPGIFDYKDPNGGSAIVSQTTYGMPPGPTQSGSAATGTVCVRPTPDSTACAQVCCTGEVTGECPTGVSCVNGRCGGVS